MLPRIFLPSILDHELELEDNILKYRSTRNGRKRLRTLAFGSDTTRDQAHTICTRNIERCRGRKRSKRCTRTWRRGTELDLGRFMCVFSNILQQISIFLTYPWYQILKVVEIEKTSDVKRPYLKQLLAKNLKFPLPHRVAKGTSKKIFSPHRPSTFA